MPALEHILAIEVGALSIGSGRGMHHGSMTFLVKTRKDRHGRMEGEEPIKRERRMLTGERKRDLTMPAIAAATSRRSFMPSGEAQAATVSGQPFGPGGCHKGMPMV